MTPPVPHPRVGRPRRRRRSPQLLVPLLGVICVLPIVTSDAAAKAPADSTIDTSPSQDSTLATAIDAYRDGDWAQTETLLALQIEALLARFPERNAMDAALIYLDAAYRLQASQQPLHTTSATREAVLRGLVEQTPSEGLPPEVYGPETYEAFEAMRRTLEEEETNRCKFEVAACNADAASLQAEYARLREDHAALTDDYERQEVEVRDFGIRTRALALLPFGLGHFYNNRPKVGATFLATEIAFGATALGLLLTRVVKYNCARTAGFKSSSLDCDVRDTTANRQQILAVRQSEEVFGWLFLTTVVADIITSQILFKPYGELRRRKVPRDELDNKKPSPEKAPAQSRLRLRPKSGVSRRGLSFGLQLDF